MLKVFLFASSACTVDVNVWRNELDRQLILNALRTDIKVTLRARKDGQEGVVPVNRYDLIAQVAGHLEYPLLTL